jgi:hypothetical protein
VSQSDLASTCTKLQVDIEEDDCALLFHALAGVEWPNSQTTIPKAVWVDALWIYYTPYKSRMAASQGSINTQNQANSYLITTAYT